jgi:hypothetical protein
MYTCRGPRAQAAQPIVVQIHVPKQWQASDFNFQALRYKMQITYDHYVQYVRAQAAQHAPHVLRGIPKNNKICNVV